MQNTTFHPGYPSSTTQERETRRRTNTSHQRHQPISIQTNLDLSPSTFKFSNKHCETYLLANVKDLPIDVAIAFSLCGRSFKEKMMFIQQQKKQLKIFRTPINQNGKNLFDFSDLPNPFDEYVATITKWFELEQKVRFALRKFVQQWLVKKYKSKLLNTDDIFTMDSFKQPIYIFDVKSRGTYVFEKASIIPYLETQLGYCKWLFPHPTEPKNPYTNIPFHDGQVLSLLDSIRGIGKGSWLLEGYRSTGFRIHTFKETFTMPLRLYGLDQLVKNITSEETCELLQEFIEDMVEYHEKCHGTKRLLLWAVENDPTNPYILSWLSVWKAYYKLIILHGTEITYNTPSFIGPIYKKSLHLLLQTSELRALRAKRLDATVEPSNTIQMTQTNQTILPSVTIHLQNELSIAEMILALNSYTRVETPYGSNPS